MYRFFILCGIGLLFLAVAFGAFGAHALKNILDEYGKNIYHTALLYQVIHAFGLIITGIMQYKFQEMNINFSGWSFLAGIIVFSGSLYLLAVSGKSWLGAITPIGGILFLSGWAWFFFCVLKQKF